MIKIRIFLKAALLLSSLCLAAYSANLRAEDIDIYMDNATGGELPNVLFVVDNSANVGSTWGGGGCSSYADGTGAPSLGTNTAGGVIQCALVDTIRSLPNGRMKVGIMSGNANNFGTSKGCVGSEGGCLLYGLTEINATSRIVISDFIKSWKKENSGETATSFPFTVVSAPSGGMMQESWAYYNGKTGLSGRSYPDNQLHACQKNFIIYIGNTDKSPANEDLSGPTALTAAGANTTQKSKITDAVDFEPAICGTKKIESLVAGSSANDWSSNWGDEWARLMLQKDGGTSTMEGTQNITTYTIGIIDNASNQCTADYPALLQSMATHGGGKAYRVSDAGEVKKALAEALNEVQAVNSVFSSASLPVSVNAEGSYLNQIFLGMFRPDSTGSPRWMGNLKQYQLFRNNAGQLVMGDATLCANGTTYCPKPAISSGGTGFLSPNALSFWTYRNDGVVPDSIGGFFVADLKGTPPTGHDYPPKTAEGVVLGDGEVVEKGGVAQQLRKQNVFATFDGASNTSGNPRRVYTYCPDQAADCSKELTHPDNDFSTTNTKIAAASFGSALTIPVLSIVRNGAVATVTTAGNHGFKTGSIVTIRNATQPEYNQTQTVTILNATQFTMTVPDYPVTPTKVRYTIGTLGAAGSYAITSVTRAVDATTGSAQETVTVMTSTPHPYVAGNQVQISGVTPTEFNGRWTIDSVTSNSFTFKMSVFPTSPAVNKYRVTHSPRSVAVNSITLSGGVYSVEAAAAHGFHAGQTITLSGIKGKWAGEYNKDHTIASITSSTIFTIGTPTGSPGSAGSGTVTPSTTAYDATSVSRTGTGSGSGASASANTSATVGGSWPSKWFGTNGEVDIVYLSGTSVGESTSGGAGSYVASKAKITCATADCSSFTYTITTLPAVAGTSYGSVTIPGSAVTTVAEGDITRAGDTATVKNIPAGTFTTGTTVIIGAESGSAPSSESAYTGQWTISCPEATCSSFTFGPVVQTPASPATGANIQAYSGNTSPDKDVLIKWLRGQDNHGDEKGPANGVTVRPSAHGDVLHSRPLVINYGDDSRGIVVYYGSNDGVFRAVNGNQTKPIVSSVTSGTTTTAVTVPAGGELWGLILPDHYQLINRYRTNSPELKFPGTLLTTALPKDYFVDGPTGVYQKLNADNTIARAIIYLTMRRGGRFMYALDVTQPLAPKVLWSRSHQTAGFEELGQTWSRPRLTLLQNYFTTTTNADGTTTKTHIPVLVFGAGYDPAQDNVGAENPTPYVADTMGRGIFVVDAVTGDKVFSASVSCPATSETCRKADGMKYATPSDIAFVDRDLNGFVDKFYWGDLGGNVWRADVADLLVKNWTVNRVAQLGCNAGECVAGATPRKFFFPPAVLSVRPAGDPNSYEALSFVSGDREHPLRSTDPNAAFNVNDRFFMIKDRGTTVNDTALNTKDVTASDTHLFNATYNLYDGTKNGFYIGFIGAAWSEATNQPDPSKAPTKGEKAVNAPVAVNGQIFFATNQPKDKSNMCVANLGTARAYAISPFTGRQVQNELAGGGLPPSAVTGLITITTTNSDGTTSETQEKFCIGCGLSGSQAGGTNTAPCTSALENCNIGVTIPKNLKRTYWYKK